MNPENIRERLLDELGDSPLGRAIEASEIVGYSGHTLTILVPDKRAAYLLEGKELEDLLKRIFSLWKIEIVTQLEQGYDAADPLTKVWDHVLETLRDEMARASFDTWVSESRAVALENGILTVASRNSYGRDWLENRIQETASRLVSEFFGEATRVGFVIEARREPIEPDPWEEPGDEAKQEIGSNEIEPIYDTAYQTEVNPGRIVAFPGYGLRLPEHGDLSAKEMSLWIGFRQAVWHSSKIGQGTVRNIPHQEILKFAMMSKASYFREIVGKDSIAGGLVEAVPTEWRPGLANPHLDNARRWRVHMSPRLTRRDCNAIHAVLYHAASETSSIPEAMTTITQSLKDMTARPSHDYLDDPKNQERPLAGWPKNVIEITRRILGDPVFLGDLPEDLHKAAEALQDHILSSFGTVMVSHYFLQEAAPKLGLSHGQAWTIIALRDRCWYDHVNRKQYSFAVLQNGMHELASLTSATVKSARNWLKDPAFQAFVTVEDTEGVEFPESWGWNPMVLDIRQTEPTAEEWGDILAKKFEDSGKKRLPDREKVINGQGKSDKQGGKKRSTDWEKVINGLGKNDKRLNNFIKPQLNPTKPHESPHTPRQNLAQKTGRVESRAYWVWDFLITRNAVSTPMAEKLLVANKAAGQDISRLCQQFVSWILYGYSEAGRGLANPVSNALARLNENIYASPGGDLDRLAALPPNTLRSFFDLDLAGRELPDSHHADMYKIHFSHLPDAEKRNLHRRLFG